MTRFTKLVSLSAAIALTACSKTSDTTADTTAAMADTSMAASTSTATTPAAGTTTPGTTASSTAITRININTATDAEILAIPGVGQRMLREFKEYRPYTSIEQFRREIGKYVDKAEVARLEQYIYIK